MKKLYVASIIVLMAVFFSYCHTAKKAAAAPAKMAVTFDGNIQPIIMSSCAPCHVPSKGGNKEAYDKYDNAKKDVDDIIRRVSMNPEERGFMPMKHPKLSDSTIAVFKQWKEGGLAEK